MKTLAEFQSWYASGEDLIVQFGFELTKSPYIDYHYSFIEMANPPDRGIWIAFKKRGSEGAKYLLGKLSTEKDDKRIAESIFMLGLIANNLTADTEQLIPQISAKARELSVCGEDYTRDRAIIVLGWIGGAEDLPLLAKIIETDKNPKCRAWAATSLMQMYFRREQQGDAIKVFAFPVLQKAILAETDYYALGCMITAVGEISGKSFRLTRAAVENVDVDKVEKAKKSAIRFLSKLEMGFERYDKAPLH